MNTNIQKRPYLGKDGEVTHWLVIEFGPQQEFVRSEVVQGHEAANPLMLQWRGEAQRLAMEGVELP